MSHQTSNLEQVSDDEIDAAFKNWLKADPESLYVLSAKSFRKLVGIHSFLSEKYYLKPEQAAMVRAMAGPHGFAMVRVYLAKAEQDGD